MFREGIVPPTVEHPATLAVQVCVHRAHGLLYLVVAAQRPHFIAVRLAVERGYLLVEIDRVDVSIFPCTSSVCFM